MEALRGWVRVEQRRRVDEVVRGREPADLARGGDDVPSRSQPRDAVLVLRVELRARRDQRLRVLVADDERAHRADGGSIDHLRGGAAPEGHRVVDDDVRRDRPREIDESRQERGGRGNELQREERARVVVGGREPRAGARVDVPRAGPLERVLPFARDDVRDFMAALGEGAHERKRRIDVARALDVERRRIFIGPPAYRRDTPVWVYPQQSAGGSVISRSSPGHGG